MEDLEIHFDGGGHFYLKHGASEEKLKSLPDNSIDSVVCDPPYLINYMSGKFYWDHPDNDLKPVFQECFRVLKEGGYLLAFGAPRKYHRLAVMIEDAGFEIKDQMMWLFISGFPKQVNSLGDSYDEWMDSWVDANVAALKANEGKVESVWKAPNPLNDHANQLKPAHEPICFARKTPENSGLAAHLNGGIGGMNTGDARIPYEEGEKVSAGGTARIFRSYDSRAKYLDNPTPKEIREKGRFPSNVIGEVEGYQKFFHCPKSQPAERHIGFTNYKPETKRTDGDLYDPYNKDTPHVRQKGGNPHATVKPVALMEYLIKLVTPEGGHVLDPFMGSGSTGMGCLGTGNSFTGIDMNAKYVATSMVRIMAWQEHLKAEKEDKA